MSRQTTKISNEIKRLVAQYVQENDDYSSQDIADYVGDVLGYKPSKSTVTTILHDLGLSPEKRRSVFWRKNDD